jgi:hypothetical protein
VSINYTALAWNLNIFSQSRGVAYNSKAGASAPLAAIQCTHTNAYMEIGRRSTRGITSHLAHNSSVWHNWVSRVLHNTLSRARASHIHAECICSGECDALAAAAAGANLLAKLSAAYHVRGRRPLQTLVGSPAHRVAQLSNWRRLVKSKVAPRVFWLVFKQTRDFIY